MTGKIMLITPANNLASAVYPDNMDCLGNCGLGKKIYTELSRLDTTEQFVD